MKMGQNPTEIMKKTKGHGHFKTVGRKGERGWFVNVTAHVHGEHCINSICLLRIIFSVDN